MILTFVLLAACIHAAVMDDQYVIPANINLDEILTNKRLTKNYVECVLGRVTCTTEGEKLAKAIPEALQNNCARCSDSVKEDIRKVVRHLIKELPDSWKELEEKFDPDGEYRKKYKDLLEKEGLTA